MNEDAMGLIEDVFGYEWWGKPCLAVKTASGMAAHFAADLEDIQLFAEENMARDVYITPATFDSQASGEIARKAEFAFALYAVVIDVDFQYPGAHTEPQLPSEQEAKRWIWSFRIKPSTVVHTGHGFQVWYFLKAPMVLKENGVREKAKELTCGIQDSFRKAGEGHGWKLDNTANLAQLFRLPGTCNCKCNPSVPVKSVYRKPETRYDWQELYRDFVETKPEAERESKSAGHERFEADFDRICRSCRFMEHWKDDAAVLPEPHWYYGVTIAARCLDGERIVKEVSRLYPKYDERETEKKIEHALNDTGPMTCEGIIGKLRFEGCERCPRKGSIKSPIELGSKKAGGEKNEGWTYEEIMNYQIPEGAVAVEGLLYKGLTILGGAPKAGKSFLVLNLAVAVAGGPQPVFGRFEHEKLTVLYLALEDTPGRLKKRLAPFPQGMRPQIQFITRWQSMREGGLQKLRERIKEMQADLVIIDTLQKFRGDIKIGANLYSTDYADLGSIKEMTDELGICTLLVHHTRKATDEDILNTVAGSQGVTGAADTVWVLTRPRKSNQGCLYVTGRDVEEKEIQLNFDAGIWTCAEEDEPKLASEEQQQIFDLLKREGSMSAEEVTEKLKRKNKTSTYWLLRKMEKAGLISKDAKSLYSVKDRGSLAPEEGMDSESEFDWSQVEDPLA